jgi:o-succinylbenzoate---CoA ligase
MNINWHSSKSELLANPNLPILERCNAEAILQAESPASKDHFWLSTSGSTGQIKWVALPKNGILSSAKAVNHHLQSNQTDIWLNALPSFHVGGLGILARAHLSGARIVDYKNTNNGNKWDAKLFYELLILSKATLTALVPTQLFDLIRNEFKAPCTLRGLIIGGGALSESLYFKGIELGWPVLPSYGLTECSSQVATAPLDSISLETFPSLKILSHIEVKACENNFLGISSPSLLSLYGVYENDRIQFVNPKINGWFYTEDKVALTDFYLKVIGRAGNFVKIGGESVDVSRLEKIIENVQATMNINAEIVILAVPDERLGHVIHLVIEKKATYSVEELLKGYEKAVLPFEKIRKVHVVDSIPRSTLLKIQKSRLLKLIDF